MWQGQIAEQMRGSENRIVRSDVRSKLEPSPGHRPYLRARLIQARALQSQAQARAFQAAAWEGYLPRQMREQ